MSFILASTSPRRYELMARNYKNFIVVSSPFDENTIVCDNPQDTCKQKASKKGEAVFLSQQKLTVSCDTVVSFNNKIYEKPKDKIEAASFMRQFSNNIVTVYSAASIFINNVQCQEEIQKILLNAKNISQYKIIQHHSFIEIAFIGVCNLSFTDISEKEILQYVETTEPYDKAGGFGAQSVAAKWIQGIDGDYYTVVGMPYSIICKILDVLME